MAKKMKKLLALVLALTLCVSQLALPALAADDQIISQITNPVVSSSASTDPVTGATTTQETISGTTADGTQVEQTTTTTENTQVGETPMDVTQTSQWEQTTEATKPNGDSEITKVDGEETEETGVNQLPNGDQQYYTQGSGEESSLTTSDDKNVEEEDISWELKDPADGEVKSDIGETTSETDKTLDVNSDTEWTLGESNPTSEWTQVGDVEKGDELTKQGETITTEEANVAPTDLMEKEVKLVMTVQQPLDEVRVDMKTADIEAGLHPEILDLSTVPEGTTVKVKPVTDSTGKILSGWEITFVKETPSDDRTVVSSTASDVKKEITESQATTKTEYEDRLGKPENSTDDKGNPVVTTVERIIDASGNFLGYREVKETTIVGQPVSSFDGNLDEDLRKQYTDTQTTVNKGLTLPTNVPVPFTNHDNGDGTFSTMKVNEIKDTVGSDYTKIDDVVGYEIVTEIRDAEGKLLRTEVREVYGTAWTTTEIVEINPTTKETITTNTTTLRDIDEVYATEYTRKVTQQLNKTETFDTTILTETDIYEVVNSNDGSYFLYKGEMFDIVDRSVVSESAYQTTAGKGDLKAPGNSAYTWYHYAEDNQRHDIQGTSVNPDGLVGTNGDYAGTYRTYIYKIVDKQGNYRYVYCVEMGQDAGIEASYTSTHFKDNGNVLDNVNSDGAEEYSKNYGNSTRQLRSVALNGYWATSEGVGSLKAVKDLLRRHGYTTVANSITDKEALAATQTAIWAYGAPDDYTFNKNETGNANIETLRKLLVNLAEQDAKTTAGESYGGAAKGLDGSAIVGSSITLKDKAYDDNNNVKVDANGKEIYNTTVGLQLAVSGTSLNGDLVVKVLDEDGTWLKSYRLSSDGTKSMFDNVTGTVRPDQNGNYYLDNLEMTDGTKITLKVEGIQHLDDGIIIYHNAWAQDFIGLQTKKNTVDVGVSLKFMVVDPSFKHTNVKEEHLRTDTVHSTADGARFDNIVVIKTDSHNEEYNQETYKSRLHGVVTKTDLFNKLTLENVRWDYYYDYVLTVVDDENGGGGGQNNNDEVILDEEVPLAAAPKTGDPSLVMAAMSALSMAGYSVLGLKRKNEE